MCRRIVATLVVLLALTPVAFGQAASTSAQPMPTQPMPTQPMPVQPMPSVLETLPGPAPFNVPADLAMAPVSGAILPEDYAGHPGRWMMRADADAVLWFSPVHRNPTPIDTPNLTGALALGAGSDTLGDENISRHMIPGARVALGWWWMEENAWTPGRWLPMAGFETRFMFVGQRTATVTDNTESTLVRPFFNVNTATPSAVIIAAPGLATGGISARVAQSIWGGEANYWRNLCYEWPGTTMSLDGMIGLRYLNLDDNAQVTTTTQYFTTIAPAFLPAFAPFAGNRINGIDSFTAHNQFIGGQLGARGNLIFDRFVVSGQFQLAMGNTYQELNIQGSQTRILPGGGVIVSPGSLLALPSNIGRHYRNEFTLLPEFGATVTIPVNEYLSFGVTFTSIYWSRILRAADQVDRAINVAQIPNFPGAAGAQAVAGAHPGVLFNQSDLWLMGAMLNVQLRW
jgi:hypothetical protein